MSQDRRAKRDTKTVDYKKLNSKGMASGDDDCYSSAEESELDKTIAHLAKEVDDLEKEEARIKLLLTIKEKRENIAAMLKSLSSGPSQPASEVASALPKTSTQAPSAAPPAPTATPQLPGRQRLDLDPQVYLNLDTVKGTKYRAVVDYIPRNIMSQDEEVSLSESVSITYKGGSKPKLDKIQPAQWTVANVRILAEILTNDDVEYQSTTLDYLSYTAKIGEYATRYTWTSVIIFDDEYRRRQAQFGFRWGSDSPHSSMLLLRERERLPKPRYGLKPKVSSGNSGNSGTCNNYNNGRECIFGAKCRFRHECEICGGDHPSVNHKKEDEPRKEE